MDWGSISLGLEDMASLSEAVLGFDLRPPKSEQVITPPATSMATLQRLHAAAGSLALPTATYPLGEATRAWEAQASSPGKKIVVIP